MSFLQRTDFMQSCIIHSLKNNGNYSEPLRTRKADASCLHVSSSFYYSQVGSNSYIKKTSSRQNSTKCAIIKA